MQAHIGVLAAGLGFFVACDKPTQAPATGSPTASVDAVTQAASDQPEPVQTDPDQPDSDQPEPVAELDAVARTGILEAVSLDPAGVCRLTLAVGEQTPVVMQGESWICAQEAQSGSGFFVGQQVTTSVGPCGDEPGCTSTDAIVVTEPHIRGLFAKLIVDAAGACFVGLSGPAGMIYFPTADELCWEDDRYYAGTEYETHLGPCGQANGCKYWKIAFIVNDLRRPADE